MDVALEVTVVELNRYRVMRVLIDGPYNTDQVQAKVPSIASPRCTPRLKGFVDLGLPRRVCASLHKWLFGV